MRLEPFVQEALRSARDSNHAKTCSFCPTNSGSGPCNCHVGKAEFALSLFVHDNLHAPNSEELREQMGKNWVIARRSPRIVAKYGEDVVCVSPKAFQEHEKRALYTRMSRMGVAVFHPEGA